MNWSDAIQRLPEYEPRLDLWDRIDAELTADETLDRAITALPQHEPRVGLWNALEEGLDEGGRVVPVAWGRFRSVRLALAASVVLCLLGGYWFFQRNVPTETVTVAYSIETTDAMPADVPDLSTDNAADEHLEAYINQACEQQVLACKKPEVQELRHQLADLDARKAQIDKQLTVFGDDPDLVRAQVRIENERADVTKELVKILDI